MYFGSGYLWRNKLIAEALLPSPFLGALVTFIAGCSDVGIGEVDGASECCKRKQY